LILLSSRWIPPSDGVISAEEPATVDREVHAVHPAVEFLSDVKPPEPS
jgi:hypothetical protein